MIRNKRKFCPRCKKKKSYKTFYSRPKLEDGLSPYCRVCSIEYHKEYRKRNSDKFKSEKEKKRVSEYNKNYYMRNRDKIRRRQKIYKLSLKNVQVLHKIKEE